MFERVISVLDVLLLVWIVVQGEFVRFYEREVFRMNKERYEERAQWREQKRKQQSKKESAPKISASEKSMVSPSKTTTECAENKTTNVKSAEAPSTPTDPVTSITSISK